MFGECEVAFYQLSSERRAAEKQKSTAAGPFEKLGQFLREFVQSPASHVCNLGPFEFAELPIDDLGSIADTEPVSNFAQKARFLFFGLDQNRTQAFTDDQTRHRRESGSRADVSEPCIVRKKPEKKQRLQHVADGKFFGRARADQMQQRVVLLNQIVKIRQAL